MVQVSTQSLLGYNLHRQRGLQPQRRGHVLRSPLTAQSVGYSVAGSFTQSGGSDANMHLYLGYNSAGNGTYNLTGGTISARSSTWATPARGTSPNPAEPTPPATVLCISVTAPGPTPPTRSVGPASCRPPPEYIGYNSTATASFQQTGGSNTISTLSIGSGDQYVLSGGTLNVTGSIANNGTVDGGNGSATLSADCLLDLTSGTWKNYSGWTINTGTNGLLVVPAGFNVSTGLAGVTTAGLGVHVLGTTLNGARRDGLFRHRLDQRPGRLPRHDRSRNTTAINLTNGLIFSGSGSVNLISGSLTVNDAGLRHQRRHAYRRGSICRQRRDRHVLPIWRKQYLISPLPRLQFGRWGNLCLKRHGHAVHSGQPVSRLFRHGQFHPVGRDKRLLRQPLPGLQLGCRRDLYSQRRVALEWRSICRLLRHGRLHAVRRNKHPAHAHPRQCVRRSGTYNLNGGTLALNGLGQGSGSATFNFGGGTLKTNAAFTIGLPMTLTGTGGNANLNTNNYAVTLAGVLSGPGGLNKLGQGTLTLAAANVFSGQTTIAGGTLTLANSAALLDSTLDYNGFGGTLNFGSLAAVTLGGLEGSQNLALANGSSAAVGLLLGNNNQSTVYSGVLSGPGSLAKLGSGMLTLTARIASPA